MNQLLTFLAVTCFTAQDPVTGGGPDAFGDQLPVGAIIRLGTTRMRITAESVAVTISSDSKILATADSRHSVIRLWDVSSGWHLKDLADPGSSQSYIRLEFSRDSRNLISCDTDDRLAIWNLATDRIVSRLGTGGADLPFSLSHNGKFLAAGHYERGGTRIALYDVVAARRLRDFQPRGFDSDQGSKSLSVADTLMAMAFTADDKDLVLVGQAETMGVLSLETGQTKITNLGDLSSWDEPVGYDPWSGSPHTISPCGGTVATAFEGFVRIRDVGTGQQLHRVAHTGTSNVAFSPDGKCLALDSNELTIRLLACTNLEEVGSFSGHGSLVRRLLFSNDGRFLVAVTERARIYVWDLCTKRLLDYCDGLESVDSIAYSPDGHLLGAAGISGLRLWDEKSGALLWRARSVRQFAFTGNDQVAVLTGKKNFSILTTAGRDVGQGVELKCQRVLGPDSTGDEDEVAYFDLSADGSLVAYCNRNGAIATWNRHENVRDFFLLSGGAPLSFALAERSNAILFLGDRGGLRLWDTELLTSKVVFDSQGLDLRSATLSADGKQIATSEVARPAHHGGSVVKVHLWNAETGQRLSKWIVWKEDYMIGAGRIPVAFSPDGKMLAVGGENGTAHVYDACSRERVAEFRGHIGEITSLAFAPMGTHLATGSADTTILVWDLRTATKSGPDSAWSPACSPASGDSAGRNSCLPGRNPQRYNHERSVSLPVLGLFGSVLAPGRMLPGPVKESCHVRRCGL